LEKTVCGPELEYTPYAIEKEMIYEAILKLEAMSSTQGEKQ
jgi:hypothetical protein